MQNVYQLSRNLADVVSYNLQIILVIGLQFSLKMREMVFLFESFEKTRTGTLSWTALDNGVHELDNKSAPAN